MNNDYDDFDDLIDDMLDGIDKAIASLPKNRPVFSDKQVMSFEDLELGKEYIRHMGSYQVRIVLVEMPKMDSGYWAFRYCNLKTMTIMETTLEDCGIVPYRGQWWNSMNWLEAVD